MDRWHFSKLFAIAGFSLLVVCCDSLVALQGDRQGDQKDDQPPVITMGWWSRILRNDQFPDTEFFVDEIAIPDQQAKELADLFEKYGNEIEKTIIESSLIVQEQIDQAESEVERAELLKHQQQLEHRYAKDLPAEFVEKLDEVLVPNQRRRFDQAMMQRRLMQYGYNSFDIVYMFQRQLGISKTESKELGTKIEEVTKTFETEKRKLKTEVWEKLAKHLPDKLLQGMDDLLGKIHPRTEDYAVAAGDRRSKWFNDKDWECIEIGNQSRIVQALLHPESSVGPELELTVDQRDRLSSMVEPWKKEIKHEQDQYKDQNRQIHRLKYEGKFEEAEGLRRKGWIAQKEINEKHLKLIFDSVLLPFQAKRVRQIARQQRMVEELKYGDEFELLMLIADEAGLTGAEKRQARAVIDKARKKYLEEVQELREDAEKEVLASLTAEQRHSFKELIGDFYDYPGEIEAARKKRAERN